MRLPPLLASLLLVVPLLGPPASGEPGPELLHRDTAPVPVDPAGDGRPLTRTVQAELLRQARDRRSTREARAAAMERLLRAGAGGALVLAPQLEREAARARREYEPAAQRFARSFEHTARRAMAARQTPAALREIAVLRDRILAGARDPRLTKERIAEVSDPALARLDELLQIELHDVLELEPDLADELDALLDSLLEQSALHGFWQRAHALLLKAGASSAVRSLSEPHDPAGEEDALHDRLDFLLLLAIPMDERDAAVLRDNRAVAADPEAGVEPEEAAGIEHLNLLRVLCGLPVLALDPRLCAASRDHSRDMVVLGFFSHTSPVEGKEDFGQRAANFGTSAYAENIAAGRPSGAAAIRAWWHSPGHHRNLLGGRGRVGLGRYESTWTQMFG